MSDRVRCRAFFGLFLVLASGLFAGACGRGIFSASSSSSGGGGGNGGVTTRRVYISNFADGKISAIARDTGTGNLSSPVTIASGKASGPLGMAASAAALYVANAADGKIHQLAINSTGNLSDLATIAAGTKPQTVALTSTGDFAYAINFGGSISEYTVDTTTGKLAANKPKSTVSGLIEPVDATATDAFLYVTDQASGTGVVLTFTISNGLLLDGPSSTPSLGVVGGPSKPGRILIDPTATFVFVSDGNGLVSVFQAVGSGLSFIMDAATSAPGTMAAGLAYTTPANATTAYLYCANPAANNVSRFSFNSATGALTLFGATAVGSGLNQPMGLAVDSNTAGLYLYVTNAGNGTVTQFTISSVDGSLSNPQSISTESTTNSGSSPEFVLVTG